ncbi:MAG: flagellar motor switch protein FliN [Pelagibacterium sp. SCN 63-23]|nr:MAG: flagellar motor switch protein FliN [Pelagibacterium sp. SCN 63-23]
MAEPENDITATEGLSLDEMTAPERDARNQANVERSAADLEAVFDVPVRVSVVLGRTKMPVSTLLKLDTGTVIELDRQVGEAVEIFINDRLVARGEIVLVENRLGVTMTEIIKPQ